MIHIHKYKTIAESNGWLIERCEKCNKERETQLTTGYQPKPKEDDLDMRLKEIKSIHNIEKTLEKTVEWFIKTGKKKVEIPGGGKTYVLRFSVREHEDDLF